MSHAMTLHPAPTWAFADAAWARRASTCAAFGLATLAGLVLLGWQFELEILKRIRPGLVAMNPATAVCFGLLAVALWLLGSTAELRWKRAGLVITAALPVFVGALRGPFAWPGSSSCHRIGVRVARS